MNYIDLHADSVYLLQKNISLEFGHNTNHIDIEKLKQANSYLQCLAIFNISNKVDNLYDATIETYLFYKKLLDKYDQLSLVDKFKDIELNKIKGKSSILMTLEDAGGAEGKIERMNQFYDLGIRMMSLTWNYENCFGYPTSKNKNIMESGLKSFGFEAVEFMNDRGVVIDVSHLSDGGTRDIIRSSKSPIIASHSNAREICNHERNLPDDIIRSIGEMGGVIGVNFYDLFVSNDKKSNVNNLVKQITYLKKMGGLNVVSIGTDFDGFSDDGKMDIKNVGEIYKLWDALKSNGFSEREIDCIAWENANRVFENILK